MRRRFDLTPLGHPIWWGALALLLVNDSILKGRGVAPGWLTGKLSDFAFLVVAPVVCAALIPRRVPGRRTFALAAVAGLFFAADLSRAVSDTVVALAARLGLTWRLWPDPTDLLALAVLPVTIWLLRRPAAPAGDGAGSRRARSSRERAGVVLGALACIATSALPMVPQHPFLHNRTAGDVAVRITWVLRKVDCATPPEALAATLGPSDLDDPRAMTLPSGDVAALDGPPAPGTSPVRLCANDTRSSTPYNSNCVAAILETDGAEPVLMVTPKMWTVSEEGGSFCSEPEPVSECAPHLDPNRRLREDTLGISTIDGTPRFEVSRTGRTEQGAVDSYIKIAPIDPAAIATRPPMDGGCREARDAYRATLQSATACATDADCTTLPPPSIPGETASCAIYVNKSASAAAFATLDTEWNAACASAGDWCVEASRPVCKSGACADPCAGLALPTCPVACGVDYARMSAKTPCQAAFSCQQSDGLLCTCEAGYLSCKSPPPADARCPIGCLPATAIRQRPPYARIPSADAGTIDPDHVGADGGAGADGGSGGDADGGSGGEADGRTDAATADPSDSGAG